MALASAAQSCTIAVDTHAHVFRRDLPMVPGRRYTPDDDATLQAYLAHLDRCGLSHGVLVQPSFLGIDNRFLMQSLRAAPDRLRGVAVVEPGISAVDLGEMDRVGIVGIRLNLFGCELPTLTSAAWRTLLAHVNGLGWHVEVHAHAGNLPQVVAPLLDLGCRVVVDHFGRPDPTLGADDPGFRYLLTQACSGRVWVKLSAAYRNEPHLERGNDASAASVRPVAPGNAQESDFGRKQTEPETGSSAGLENAMTADPADRTSACTLARLLINAFGSSRLMWGSDWPHTEHGDVASFEGCFSQLDHWVADPNERSVMLGATPAKLFKIQETV